MSAFELLIGTILSQNTSDANSRRALLRLRREIGLDPNSLSRAGVEDIKRCIRSAGLYNVKAPRIKGAAKYLLENYPNGLEALFNRSSEAIRAELTRIEGVGPKTADMLLAFYVGRDVLPVDTHVRRVSARLGFVSSNARYEEIRRALEEATPRGIRGQAHLALIWLGRNVCHPKNPECHSCPVGDLCPSKALFQGA